MSFTTPMLETKEVPPPIVPAEVVPATVPTDAQKAGFELKATKLRRAATALLFFSVVCSRPWPSVGWAGLVSAFAILCASPNTILCRARVGRFFSAITVIFAGIAFVTTVMSIRSGAPQHISDQVHNACNDMPADTFSWGHKIVNEHPCLHKAVAMISRHVSNDTAVALVTPATASWRDANSSFLVASEAWSQPEACDKIAKVVTCASKMMMIGSAVAHLFLFLAAMSVVKRACCLRCAAFRSGMLKWKCGGRRCKYLGKPPTTVTPGVPMELA